MLFLLVLCALLQSLQGALVPPPRHLPGSLDTSSIFQGVLARDSPAPPDNGGQELRTVYSIVQSCVLTIFACVWKSIHPNINGPRDSGWTCLKQRVVIMVYALIAPEMVLYWALRQRWSAQVFANKYNDEFARPMEKTARSIPEMIVGWFQPLPVDTTRRGGGQPWTIAHGFFIQMGGFLLYENEYPKEVLDFNSLTHLIREGAIDAPTVTERNLQDHSRGDVILKGIVLLQTTWFVVQCITRGAQSLPLSELEVVTLAFAVMNAAIYWAWWDKPQGVDTAICLPLKSSEKVADDATAPLPVPEKDTPSQTQDHHSNDDLPLLPRHELQHCDERPGQKQGWLRCMLRKERNQHSSLLFIISLSHCIVDYVLYPFKKIDSPAIFDKKQLRVPMFYSVEPVEGGPMIAFLVIAKIFGAIHLLAWSSEFPSPSEHILWRVSAVILVAEVLLMPMFWSLRALNRPNLASCGIILFAFGLPLYVAARVILVIIAFKAMYHPPDNVLLDIAWTMYIPHF